MTPLILNSWTQLFIQIIIMPISFSTIQSYTLLYFTTIGITKLIIITEYKPIYIVKKHLIQARLSHMAKLLFYFISYIGYIKDLYLLINTYSK